jgi:hypothetical protein
MKTIDFWTIVKGCSDTELIHLYNEYFIRYPELIHPEDALIKRMIKAMIKKRNLTIKYQPV